MPRYSAGCFGVKLLRFHADNFCRCSGIRSSPGRATGLPRQTSSRSTSFRKLKTAALEWNASLEGRENLASFHEKVEVTLLCIDFVLIL